MAQDEATFSFCVRLARRNSVAKVEAEPRKARSVSLVRIVLWVIGIVVAFILLGPILSVGSFLTSAFATAWMTVVPQPAAYGLSCLIYLAFFVLRRCCRSPKARFILLAAILLSVAVNFVMGLCFT